MSKLDTKQFQKRKTQVGQALKSENFHLIKDCDRMATINQLVEVTKLNEQSIKRIVNHLTRAGKVEVIKDKSYIVLLRKKE